MNRNTKRFFTHSVAFCGGGTVMSLLAIWTVKQFEQSLAMERARNAGLFDIIERFCNFADEDAIDAVLAETEFSQELVKAMDSVS